MTNSEKLLKDLDLRIARFGNSDIASHRPLAHSRLSYDLNRLYREMAAKLVFKME